MLQIIMHNPKKNYSDAGFITWLSQGNNLRELPLLKRKAALKRILSKTKNNRIRFTDHVIGEGLALFA